MLAAPAVAIAPASAAVMSIDTTDFSEVLAAYQEQYLPAAAVESEWSGTGDCTVGSNSEGTRQAGIDVTNYFRAMAGLDPVVEYQAGNDYTDAAVTLIEAQGTGMAYLGLAGNAHQPVNTLDCWTQDAYDGTNSSSLAFASAPGVFKGPGDAVRGWIDDKGNETTLGHRRWLLNPAQTAVGLSFGPTSAALGSFSPSALKTGTPSELAWPNAGYIPFEILPTQSNQWSYSMPGANFSAATVTVSVDGADIATEPQPVGNPGPPNYPNALSWIMPTSTKTAPAANTVIDYEVTIQGITGGARSSVNYHVLVFTAASWTAEAPLDPPAPISDEALAVRNLIQALPEEIADWVAADAVAEASLAFDALEDQGEISAPTLARLQALQVLAAAANHSDTEHGAVATGAVLPWYVRLHALESSDYSVLNGVRGNATPIALYDIFFTDTLDGSVWEFPAGEQVMISLSHAGIGPAGTYRVVHLPSAGGVEFPVATRTGNTVSFVASSFSPYAILFTKQNNSTDTARTDVSDTSEGLAHTGVDTPALPLGIGAAFVLAGLAVLLLRRSNRA